MITNDKSFDFGFEPNYIIEIGDSKYKKTGKHNLLTTMECHLDIILFIILM